MPALQCATLGAVMLTMKGAIHTINGAPMATLFKMLRYSETRASSFFIRRISVSFSASPDDAFANVFFQA